jgi:hypothetical protein
MNSTAESCLLAATVILWLTAPAPADYCRYGWASLVRTGKAEGAMNVGEAP